MIRRGFWLALGAALGVAGYRRAGRLARAIRPYPGGARLGHGGIRLGCGGTGAGARPRRLTGMAGRHAAGGPGGATAFLRDVRDGMDEYLERRQAQRGPTLEGQQPPAPGRAATGQAAAGQAETDRAAPGQAAAGRPRQLPGIDYAKDGS